MITETHDRSSFPDSSKPGHGNLSNWLESPYSVVVIAIGLFIIIFGIAIFLGYRQFETTRHNALSADKTTVNLLADLILEHNKATIGILQSYAHRPLFIDAVKNKNIAGAYRHLSDLKKNAEIDLTFVTDACGILWANFPVFPEAIGKDLSSRDWYKGISSHWKPYISTVFQLIVGDKPLAVAICVPISDEKERVIGILASSQRLGFLNDTIEKVAFSPYTTMNVIDRVGQILYSNNFPYRENVTDYRFFSIIEAAIKEKKQQIEMNDPQKGQAKSYLTVVPIGDSGWTIITERSLSDIYRSDLRRFIEIGTVSLLLFLLIFFILVYLRKAAIFRKTEELLQAEIKLRQRDEKLQALSSRQEAILAAVPEILMEVDSNKAYTWANSAGIEFFGEDVIGKEAAFYFEGEQDIYDTVRPLFGGAEDIIYVESWQRRRDGQKRLLAWWCRVLKDENGQVTGALSSARDITELKAAESALLAKNEEIGIISQQLLQATKLATMGELASSIAHELNNPLAIVSLRIESLMAQTGKADPHRRELEIVGHEVERMGNLVTNVLQFSHRGSPQISTVDVCEEIEKTLELIYYHLRNYNIRLVREFDPDIPKIIADRQQLRQLFLNIVTNASDAMHGGGTLTIRVAALNERGKVRIEIADTGAGIPPEVLLHVMEPFYTTKPEGMGTGLGLAICRRIVQEHQGTLTLTSDGISGKGTTVLIALSSIDHTIVDGQILKGPLSIGEGLVAGEKYHESTA